MLNAFTEVPQQQNYAMLTIVGVISQLQHKEFEVTQSLDCGSFLLYHLNF